MPTRDLSTKQSGTQQSISRFFTSGKSSTSASGKRARSPVDLTLDSDEEPAAKRVKNLSQATSSVHSERDGSKPESPLKKKYKFVTMDDSSPPVPDAETRQKQAERRRIWKETLKQTNRDSSPITDNADDILDVTGANTEEEEQEEPVSQLQARFALKMSVAKSGSGSKSKKKNEEIGPSGQPYTPLELQVKQLKEENPGTLLLFEVGYKYRFFGEDARVASKALGIACFVDRNFLTASIPVHRKMVHTKKLLSLGHRVGIVGQTETAALKKVGNNKSGPFRRQVTELYTATTFVDEMDSIDESDGSATSGLTATLICLTESLMGGMGEDEKVNFGLIAVTPSTGEVVYDEFSDTATRPELETRLAHIKPRELLLSRGKVSKYSGKVLRHYADQESARIEYIEEPLDYTKAFEALRKFYVTEELQIASSTTFEKRNPLNDIVDLPKQVVIAMAHAIQYLLAYGLSEAFRKTSFFIKFLTRSHMLLNANTLTNLEIFQNQTDFSRRGSLIWLLDRTTTRFGSRQLRQWVAKPLVNKPLLQERFEAIKEIQDGQSATIVKLRTLLKGLPDLVKGLSRIQYKKSNPKEVAAFLSALSRVANTFDPFEKPEDVGFKCGLLNDIVFSLPKLQGPIKQLMEDLDLKQAREGVFTDLWTNPEKYPEIEDAKYAIISIDMHMQEHLKEVRKFLKRASLEWVSVAGVDYLIEIPNADKTKMPTDWNRVQGTKKVTRFHTPEARLRIQERDQRRETLDAVAKKAFESFQAEINAHYTLIRDVVNKLAIFDALISLAHVATLSGYVQPDIIDGTNMDIFQGRHPLVEMISSSPFVPNDVKLGSVQNRAIVITGPNMGGKSSIVRMIALIAIMSQIGCYVPAERAKVPIHDAILTRMGAFDEISRGRSTFMVEMNETAEILRSATEKSLIILDELGRGTATYDGVAIASSVLEHAVTHVKCKTLFITHYPQIGLELSQKFPDLVMNAHMGYIEEQRVDGIRDIHFLYLLKPGITERSFGVECGRLAGLPESVLETAAAKSEEWNKREHESRTRHLFKLVVRATDEASVNNEGIQDLIRQMGTHSNPR